MRLMSIRPVDRRERTCCDGLCARGRQACPAMRGAPPVAAPIHIDGPYRRGGLTRRSLREATVWLAVLAGAMGFAVAWSVGIVVHAAVALVRHLFGSRP